MFAQLFQQKRLIMISPIVKKENNIVERVATRSATKFSSIQQIYTHQSSFVETNPNAQQR